MFVSADPDTMVPIYNAEHDDSRSREIKASAKDGLPRLASCEVGEWHHAPQGVAETRRLGLEVVRDSIGGGFLHSVSAQVQGALPLGPRAWRD